jgi:hypothetical protein
MDEPVDTAAVAAHLKATQGLRSIDIPTAYYSNWLDNTRAKFDLNWRRTPISPSSSAPPGLFSARPAIHGRLGIPANGRRAKKRNEWLAFRPVLQRRSLR